LFCMLSGTSVNPSLVPAFASSIPFGISTQWHCQPNDWIGNFVISTQWHLPGRQVT
jgi:hypothetical protein